MVAPHLKNAEISVKGSIEYFSENHEEVTVELYRPTGLLLQNHVLKAVQGIFQATITLEGPELWYPYAYGAQPLYTVTVQLPSHDRKSQAIGLRRLRLLQTPLKNADGTSFLFEINNIRIFAGGSNWIPGDFMLPRMTRQHYSNWLKLAKSGNQTMIRVWGGGIVESDDFYDICDLEGILVWQDFLFACGDYPASKEFKKNVKEEVEQQVKRVGHHASLVLWAGNNEDYMVAERWGWEYDIKDQEGPWEKTNFPAREICERLLPSIVEELGGDVPYWRSSPYGGAFSNDTTVGDTHVWDGKFPHHLPSYKQPEDKKLTEPFPSLARQDVSLPRLQELHFPLHQRVWLRILPVLAHLAPRHHHSLRTARPIPHLRYPRQRPCTCPSLPYVHG
jgi:beta-mannosidase